MAPGRGEGHGPQSAGEEESASAKGAERMTEGSSAGDGLLEIIQLENGDVVLRRTQHPEGEPLVLFRFSRAMLERFGDDLLEVVEAMLDAAADAASDLHEQHSGESRNGWALMFHDEGSTLH
jgi:hypothetical protein